MRRFEKVLKITCFTVGTAAMTLATPVLAHDFRGCDCRLRIGYHFGGHTRRFGLSRSERAIGRMFAAGYGGYLGGYAYGPYDTSGPPYYAGGAYPFLYYRYPAAYLRAYRHPDLYRG